MSILGSHGRFPGSRGFTLIEVILSILILSLGIVSVQRVFMGSLPALNVIENRSQAERLLDEKIWKVERDVREQGKKFKRQNENGMILGSNRTFRYGLSFRELSPDTHLMEAQALIAWGKPGMSHSIKRTFYLMEPYADWEN